MTREDDIKRHITPAPNAEVSLDHYLPQGDRNAAARPGAAATSIAAIESALARLEETIDAETAALEANRDADFEDINRRKSRCLLELTRLTRNLPVGWEQSLGGRVTTLRDKLNRNAEAVRRHLRAVREIADLMANALHEAESDGTYGLPGGYGATP